MDMPSNSPESSNGSGSSDPGGSSY
jgi:hypothetical protein